jgi:hypothetical protein
MSIAAVTHVLTIVRGTWSRTGAAVTGRLPSIFRLGLLIIVSAYHDGADPLQSSQWSRNRGPLQVVGNAGVSSIKSTGRLGVEAVHAGA